MLAVSVAASRSGRTARLRASADGVDVVIPGVANPSATDMLGIELADHQLDLVFGLRAVRAERALSVDDVAAAMGVEVAEVIFFEEGGANPRMSWIRSYAKAIGATFQIAVEAADHVSLHD